ncbi:hypothetical protein LL12F51_43850 [Escherichia coli]
MLAKVTFLSCITMSDFTFSGYELACFVTHSGLSRSAGHILSQCANLAATTSEYFIHKPHRLIAAETGYSQSTVVRAFREAVNKGILSVEIVIGDHRERRANLYRFTPSFLAFAQEPRQPGGCKLKTAPVRPVVAARPAEYVCSEDLFY